VYKSKRYRPNRFCLFIVVIEIILYATLPSGCSKSRRRDIRADAADEQEVLDAGVVEIEDSGRALLDGDQTDGNQDPSLDEITISPPNNDPEAMFPDAVPPEPPEEAEEALETLKRPDFTRPIEDLTAEGCGYIFTAESTTDWVDMGYPYPSGTPSTVESGTIVETRSFDKDGRLVAAEIVLDPNAAREDFQNFLTQRRLQIDYDQRGRPIRIRISPAFRSSEPFEMKDIFTGSVAQIEYYDDGSSQSLYVTDSVELYGGVYMGSFFSIYNIGGWYFCDWLRFDPHGNLVERKWDCYNPTVVQSRTYDEQQRLLSDHGFYLYDLIGVRVLPHGWSNGIHTEPWQIDMTYDDAHRRETIVWTEPGDGSIIGRTFAMYGMYSSSKPREHSIVHTYNESGKLIRSEYDHENDGRFDELVSYAYQDSDLLSKEIDFWIDGVLDITELHTRTANRHRIERRNMTANSDVMYSSLSAENDMIGPFTDSSAILPPQSQSVIELERDEQSRLVEVDLEIQWIYMYWPENQRMGSELVSESWHETSVYADEGYVKEKQLVWHPSDALLEAQGKQDAMRIPDGGRPYIFLASSQSTTCTLTPLCEGTEITLPEDERLLTCEVGVVFPQYRVQLRIPSINQDEFYTVPPYDALPGIHSALYRLNDAYTFSYIPYVRDIVGY
jgi:hypothetical protein